MRQANLPLVLSQIQLAIERITMFTFCQTASIFCEALFEARLLLDFNTSLLRLFVSKVTDWW